MFYKILRSTFIRTSAPMLAANGKAWRWAGIYNVELGAQAD